MTRVQQTLVPPSAPTDGIGGGASERMWRHRPALLSHPHQKQLTNLPTQTRIQARFISVHGPLKDLDGGGNVFSANPREKRPMRHHTASQGQSQGCSPSFLIASPTFFPLCQLLSLLNHISST